jgi:O-methyltransferase
MAPRTSPECRFLAAGSVTERLRSADHVLVLADGVELRRQGDQQLIVDPSGRGLALNEVASAIASRLAVPTTPAIVCEYLRETFEVDLSSCSAAVEDFLGDLRRRSLVQTYDAPRPDVALRRRYLDLMMRSLVNLLYPEHELRMAHLAEQNLSGDHVVDARVLRDIALVRAEDLTALVDTKVEGGNWRGRVTSQSHTMIGLRRLENLERVAARVFHDGVPGDFLEAGVCQGGASIFLRALQVAYAEAERRTWAADSFAGLPAAEHAIDVEHGMNFTESVQPWLAASLATVQEHFRRYDLLSDNVRFLPGWFAETLPDAPVDQLAILRLDGDLYTSTRDVLDALYDRVSVGGYVIVDDYGAFAPCRAAVDEFRTLRCIDDEMQRIDWSGVFWRKTG